MSRFALSGILVALAGVGWSQPITSRADLNAILTASTTDDFEALAPTGGIQQFYAPVLSSTTVVSGQFNLVHPGATYANDTSTFLWMENGHNGLSTRTLGGFGTVMQATYATPVHAVGFDVKALTGPGYAAYMNVYRGNTLLAAVNLTVAGGSSTFVGYHAALGITRTQVIKGFSDGRTPIIDNHTYGTTNPVPAPATMALAGLALAAAARRKQRLVR